MNENFIYEMVGMLSGRICLQEVWDGGNPINDPDMMKITQTRARFRAGLEVIGLYRLLDGGDWEKVKAYALGFVRELGEDFSYEFSNNYIYLTPSEELWLRAGGEVENES